jgi:hypothetical protein
VDAADDIQAGVELGRQGSGDLAGSHAIRISQESLHHSPAVKPGSLLTISPISTLEIHRICA